jgi:hypothetical protein
MQHGSQHAEGTGLSGGGAQAAPSPYNRKATMRQELDMMLNGRYHVNRQLNSARQAARVTRWGTPGFRSSPPDSAPVLALPPPPCRRAHTRWRHSDRV